MPITARNLIGRSEVLVFLGAYLVYSMSRYIAVGDVSTAVGHAEWIVGLEDSVSMDFEGAVQDALHGTVAIWILNDAYLAAQLVVVPVAAVVPDEVEELEATERAARGHGSSGS